MPVAQTDKIANSFFLATTILLQLSSTNFACSYTLSISSISYKTCLNISKAIGVETFFTTLVFIPVSDVNFLSKSNKDPISANIIIPLPLFIANAIDFNFLYVSSILWDNGISIAFIILVFSNILQVLAILVAVESP